MEISKKTLIGGVFAMLLLGVVLVSASSYYSTYEFHKRMMSSDDFEAMHTSMMSGDFKAAEKYHETLDFECPMHDLVRDGDVSLDDFQMMHEWMISGDFPEKKPAKLSNAAWELHLSHHPEIYK